ncbi:MAG: sugar transferase, partial [Acidobacteria bacterium]
HEESVPEFGLFIKRLLDVVGALIALLLLTPLFTVVSILIKLDSPGPVFYRAERVGRKGRRFLCCKFRTMISSADAIKSELRQRNERSGAMFKITDDPRITRLGHFVRRYSIDELPQFWNVLKGEMSLVGPRPHPVDDCARYQLDDLRRLDMTPGLTGLWQVTARRDPSFQKSMALDLHYIENWSLWMDLRILLKTFPVVLAGTGA